MALPLPSLSALSPFEAELLMYTQADYSDVSDDDDPAGFWRKESILQHLPMLANLAMDLLAIPISSAEVERVFSVAGLVSLIIAMP